MVAFPERTTPELRPVPLLYSSVMVIPPRVTSFSSSMGDEGNGAALLDRWVDDGLVDVWKFINFQRGLHSMFGPGPEVYKGWEEIKLDPV